MTPFIRLTAVPQALNSDLLDGIDSSGFVQLGATQSGNINIGSGTITSGAITAVGVSAGSGLLQGTGGINVTGAVNLATSGSSGISIGTGSYSSTIALGNSAATSVSLTAGNIAQTISATGFAVQNSNSASVFNISTSGGNASNLLANPSFESTITGSGAGVWVAKGSASAPTNNTSQFYNQLNSAKVITTAAAGDGIKQQLSTTLTGSTAYNIVFYVKLDSGSNAMASDLQAGYSSTGASDDTPCSLSQSVVVTGWTRYICTFTTPASPTSSNYFYIKQTDAVIHTFYVDAVLLQLTSTADSNYRDSQISLNGTIVSPVVLQGTTNTTDAFTIQNATGGQVFNVDTTDSNLLNNPANPGFEVNTTGWTTVVNGGTVSLNRDTSQKAFGLASLLVTTSANTAQGARYTLASGNWPINVTTTYTVSFSMLNSGTAFAAVPIVKFGNGSDNACSAVTIDNGATATIPNTSAWTRYAAVCTFSGTVTSIAIEQNEATAHTFYIDSVQLETGGTATVYGLGAISINAQIVTPTTFKNQTNSTSAFQIQNSAGTIVLGVDTNNTIVSVGATGAVATASTANIGTSTGAAQTINIGGVSTGTPNASTAVFIDAGNTGKIQIGNTTAAHTIQIGAGGAAAGNAEAVTIGSPSTSTAASTVTLQGSNITTTNANAGVIIGGGFSSSDTNLVALTLDSSSTFAETASTCTATVNEGALYYNSNSNEIRACINTSWQDLASTEDLALQLFGVVPNSGPTPGDLVGANGNNNSPCKVYWVSATQYGVAACNA